MATSITISKQIPIKDEGVVKTSDVNSIDFTGAGVTATNVGNAVTVNIPGGGGSQVGYRGFKYTVTEQTDGAEPNPTPGQAILWFADDGEGGTYYAGIYLSRYNADGTDMFNMFYKLLNSPKQPYVLVNSAGVISINEISSATFSGSYSKILLTDGNGAPNIGSSGGICYFHFQTTNTVPAYTGYVMNGNLNGTTFTTGLHYIGFGSSTASTVYTQRCFNYVAPQLRLIGASITTSGTMTGTMTLRVLIAGAIPISNAYIIPTGSAAASYPFAQNCNTNYSSSNMAIEISQSGTSCGIVNFNMQFA